MSSWAAENITINQPHAEEEVEYFPPLFNIP
jgi:hypothetical protein